MKQAILLLILCAAVTVQADDPERASREREREREQHNWILERQLNYQVEGVPTSRLIIGTREIDIYPHGEMFERNHMVGVTR